MLRLLLRAAVSVSMVGATGVPLVAAAQDSPPPTGEFDVSALLAKLDGTPKEARDSARKELATILPGEVDLLPALRGGLKSGNPVVVKECALGIGRIGPEAVSAAPDLVTCLADKDPGTRIQAARALGRTARPAPDVRKALVAALADSDPWVRLAAARAMGRLGVGDSGAFGAVLPLLKDGSATMRRETVETLGDIGAAAASAVSTLIGLIENDPDPSVRSSALDAVYRVDSQMGIFANAAAQRKSPGSIKVVGGGRSTPTPSLQARVRKITLRLQERFKEAEPGGRREAVEALGRLPREFIPIEPVIAGLDDPDPSVRAAALVVAKDLSIRGKNSEPVLSRLVRLAKDPAPEVRRAAVGVFQDAPPWVASSSDFVVERIRNTTGAEKCRWAMAGSRLVNLMKALDTIAEVLKKDTPARDPTELLREVDRSVPAILRMFEGTVEEDRNAASDFLEREDCKFPGATDSILRVLRSKDPRTIEMALRTINGRGPPLRQGVPEALLPSLRTLASHEDEMVAAIAKLLLEEKGQK